MKSIVSLNLGDEAVLPFEIQPHPTPINPAATPNTIFLTGATGFVAAFVLVELLKQTQANIFALVRADNTAHGLNRIRENLQRYLLWQDHYEQRIVPVVGDLKLPLLGLTPVEFQ